MTSPTRSAEWDMTRHKALVSLQKLNALHANHQDHCVNVSMIGEEHVAHQPPSGGGGFGANWSALLAPALQAARPEKFSGYDEDWAEFVKGWSSYAELVYMHYPSLPDRMWLTLLLKPVLDTASALKMDNMIAGNPQLLYAEFWRELERTFGRDLAERHRRD